MPSGSRPMYRAYPQPSRRSWARSHSLNPATAVLCVAAHGPLTYRSRRILWVACAIEAGLGAVAAMLGWVLQIRWWEDLHMTPQAWLAGVLATLPMLAGLALLMRVGWRPFIRFRRLVRRLLAELFADMPIWALGAISLAAGFGEEALFRGLLQPLCEWVLPPLAALIVVSLLFGSVHMVSRLYFVLASIVGFYLGAITLALDSLTPAVVAHALYDWIALVYLTRRTHVEPAPGNPQKISSLCNGNPRPPH